MYEKLRIHKWVILFSILVLVVCIIFSGIMTVALPVYPIYGGPFYMAIAALLIAIAIKKPKELYLNSRPKWNKFHYYLVPLIVTLLIPFLYGGYKSLPSKWHAISVLFVGVGEEIIMHSIAMGCMIMAWGHSKKSLLKAAIIGSLIFGITHLIGILQNPGDIHFVSFKIATVFFAFLISMCFAGLVHETNTIWFAAIMHGIVDAVVGNIGDPERIEQIMSNWGLFESLISILVTLPLGLFGYWLIVKNFKKKKNSVQ